MGMKICVELKHWEMTTAGLLSRVIPVSVLDRPLRKVQTVRYRLLPCRQSDQVVEDVIILYAASDQRLAARVTSNSYSRHAAYNSNLVLTFGPSCLLALSNLLRLLSSDVKVQALPITIYEPDQDTLQILIPMVQKWYGPPLVTQALRFLGQKDPAMTLHFVTTIKLSTITGKVVSHQDSVQEFPQLPSLLKLFLGAPLPMIATLAGI